MTESIRLAKRVAQLVPCSRREAELYIQGGWVRVDGKVVEEPQFKVGDERVELHPQAKAEPLEPATLLLHLPAGRDPETALQLITPAARAADDASGVRMLQSHFKRLSMGLPLEPGAAGLVVFTQDRRVLRQHSEDADRLEQEYTVEVAGELAEGGLKLLERGLRYQGQPLQPAKVSWQSENRLRFALKAPRPGQIRYACERVGLKVLAIKRIRIGRVAMAKLAPGQWRYLAPSQRF